ncbi:MAG: DivIVA domain-containing protein [Bacilli bacterium]|nr:DivIVA domain-containing protein [Bacilli bacterium]
MATKTNYTPYTLLHKKFPANVKGYDPEKVDETLDEIILDYKAFEKYYTESRSYIAKLEEDVIKLREDNKRLLTENTKLNSRLQGIKEKDDSQVSTRNIDLIQKIRKYEKALHERGINPDKL